MRIRKSLKSDIPQILILTLIFLSTMNCFNMYFYFIFAAFMLETIIVRRNMKVDFTVVILICISLLYITVYYRPFNNSLLNGLTLALKQFAYPICYLLGLNFLRFERFEKGKIMFSEKWAEAAIIVPALGPFVHYLLNLQMNYSSVERNTVDFWTGEVVSATGQAGLAVMAVGVFSAWIFSRRSKKIKILAITGIALMLVYNLILAGRTLLGITALVMCLAFVVSFKNSSLNRKLLLLLSVIAVVILLISMYMGNAFGIRDFIRESNFFARFGNEGLGDDARLEIKALYLSNMLKYPFGGGELRMALGENYAHELYLDAYSDIGILGYIMVVAFVVIVTINAIKLVIGNRCSENMRLLFLCVYIAMITEFFLEPIIAGMPWMFCAFCFYGGMIKTINFGKSNLYYSELLDR